MTERDAKRSQIPGWVFLCLFQAVVVYAACYRVWIGAAGAIVASLAMAYGLRVTGVTEGICWLRELRDGKPPR